MKVSYEIRTYIRMCFSCPTEGLAGMFFVEENRTEDEAAKMAAEILRSRSYGDQVTDPIRFEIYPEDDHVDCTSWIFQVKVNPETGKPETGVRKRITDI